MDGYLIVLALAGLPAVANFGGALLAEYFQMSKRAVGFTLHAATGVILAIVAVEIMPAALAEVSPWTIMLAFVAGGAFVVLVERGIELLQERMGMSGSTTPWLVALGFAVDFFADGVMIGAGTTVRPSLGLLLALGHLPANLPGGFTSVALLKEQGLSRPIRLAVAGGLAVPLVVGATLGYFVVRDQPEAYRLVLLTFTAGALTTVVVDDIIPEAQESAPSRLAAPLFLAGFSTFTLLSAFL
jgi:zinc transporter, ZIP family